MRSYIITITEVDEVELAIEELEAQMSEVKLLNNSVGIVTLSTEFINSGIYAAIAKAIPFPLIGMTTNTQNANGKIGTFLLSILVLTSNDCEFAYGSSGILPVKGDVTEITQECYKSIRSKLTGKTKLALLYAPFMAYQCTYKYLSAVSGIDECVPIFGSLAATVVTRIETDMRTICGEHCFENRLVMLLISGDIAPEFYIASVTDNPELITNVGEVTAAQDNHVMEINNTKINDVLEKIGYNAGSLKDDGTLTSVFIMHEIDKDGNLLPSAARGINTLDDGVAIFGGRVPVGSVLSFAVTTKDDIATTARKTISRIKGEHSDKTILMYSCLGRQIALLDEPMMEYEIINEQLLGSSFTYVAAASGGEICPTFITETKAHNNEHNQTLIACVF
jgi:hypothetical protein